jgi:CheY-like chemotaxis protein
MAKKILIVDDEEDIIIFLDTLLKKHGYETVTARDGVAAMEAARSEKPDLITLDLQMPRDTGTDFYRKMRRDKELGQTPVIVISGIPGRHLAVPHPIAVFEKPINPDALVAAVREAIGE